jgi:hypothetical protein
MKVRKIIAAILYICLAMLAWATIKVFFGEDSKPKIEIIKQKDIDNKINQRLIETANTLNQNLPKTIDDETRLERVVAENLALAYHYTLVNQSGAASFDEVSFKENMHPILTRQICDNDQLQATKRHNIGSIFKYYDTAGNFLASISINPRDCQE